ncbi:D-glycero-beta-D-manno-heptose-7-phosphate kinase [Burkholderia contaminans]|uniref:D-glycero-beta-D-manno-heptose-7-phosphate kinase n=1 Tax=Burkholderia contaminans TaxID=488447 RepID=UPI000F5A643A|nr:D-glycero-beta-D-manno-heptose-7-phosphate kinase [Burkholderia contaminans]RQT14705.1 D-glycero-beta-D-manno-heptose-7-phosphate kinase [Burkholderia contaminans]
MSLNLSNAAVLVAGDVMLDRYWFGDTTRISPEAPVPVVHVSKVHSTAGGAANVAVNIANLGATSSLISVIGTDAAGQDLLEVLQATRVRCEFLRDANFQTTVKLRVLARGQQVVRADFEQKPDHELLLPIVDLFDTQLDAHQAVVFSDYGKGGLSHLLDMMRIARERDKIILVDPKGTDYSAYRGATLLTPNRDEFAQVAGSWSSEEDFEQKAFALCTNLDLRALLVTRSEEGMSLFVNGHHTRISAQAREVYDVSGAGDTVIATLAVALANGYTLEDAARLANRAAGVVVGKVGTAPITLDELVRA